MRTLQDLVKQNCILTSRVLKNLSKVRPSGSKLESRKNRHFRFFGLRKLRKLAFVQVKNEIRNLKANKLLKGERIGLYRLPR